MSRWRAAAAESCALSRALSKSPSLPPPPQTLSRTFSKFAAATATSPRPSSAAAVAAGLRPENKTDLPLPIKPVANALNKSRSLKTSFHQKEPVSVEAWGT